MKKQVLIIGTVLFSGVVLFSSCSKELPESHGVARQAAYTPSGQKETQPDVSVLHGWPRMQGNNPETFECVQINPPRICAIFVKGGGAITAGSLLNDIDNGLVEYSEGVEAMNAAGSKNGTLIINHLDGPQQLNVSSVNAAHGDEADLVNYDAN